MITGLDHLVLTVSDMVTSVAFYRDILGMQALEFEAADGSRRWALAFGAQKLICIPHRPLLRPMRLTRVPARRICAFCRQPHWTRGWHISRPLGKQ